MHFEPKLGLSDTIIGIKSFEEWCSLADYIRDIRALVGNAKIIMVACGALVFDEDDRILLHKRADNGYWGYPWRLHGVGQNR